MPGDVARGVVVTPHEAHDGALLARGSFFNTLAFFASNFRGVFTLLIARLLGSAALGTFGLAWATTDLVSKLSTFGFETSVVTFVARSEAIADRAASRRIVRVALTIGMTLSTIVALVGFWITPIVASRLGLRPEVSRAISVVLLALPGVTLYRVSNAASRGMAVMHHDIFSRGLTESFGSAVALLIAVAVGMKELAAPVAAIAGTVASGGVAYLAARRLLGNASLSGAAGWDLGPLIRDSAAIAVHDFLNIGIMRLDLILLGLLVGRAPGVTLATLGVYAAAVEVASGARKVYQAFNPIFTPVVARQLRAGHIDAAQATYAYLARWMLAVLLPIVAVFAVSGGAIMSIFGRSFVDGGPWLAITGLACAVNAFVGLGETILMVERPQLNALNAAVALAIATALNLLFIPALGPLGAALGMLVPYAMYGILRGVEIRWLFRWRWPVRALKKPLAAAALALPVAVGVRLSGSSLTTEVVAGTCFVLAYVGAWRIIGLDPQDRAVIDHLLRQS